MNVAGNGNVSVSWGSGNGTGFTIYQRVFNNTYRISVTNTYGSFELPATGGMGTTHYYTFGGLLILAAALMYLLDAVCRRRKGGR